MFTYLEVFTLGRIIFVTGFKGGVGKTTVSANVASTLYALGNKVLVIDGDFGMRCMDMVLGLESETLFDCSDVLSGRCSPAAAMCEVDGNTDFMFIPAPMNMPDEKYPQSAFASFFAEVREDFDYIIIDSCAEMTDYYMSFARQADEAIIVTLHQSTSVRAAEKTAIRLSAMGIKELSLVVNGYRESFAEKGRLPDIIDIINRSSVKLLGVVPYCEKLSASQEAAELSFMGNLRRKAKVWESAFYNIAKRLTGKRVLLFEGSDNQKRRSTYEGIVKRDTVQKREIEI
ncbi:MAG: AAA family ATPase [Clostridia bacterium]|nr:AAA family ATPase [Clostridia bacterium]MBR6754502.1 AAA family ATPase [Clostridia bacterium]